MSEERYPIQNIPQHSIAAFHGTPEQIDLIKRTVCKGSDNDELALFLYTAKRTGLDPLLKQIHAVKRFDSRLNREVMAIQVGIDGYRLIAERTGKYLGSKEPVYEYFENDPTKKIPKKATVTVLKLGPNGNVIEISSSAFWDEYYPGEKLGFMWRKIPHTMLSKVAESHALRKAFPAELSGIYTDDEMSSVEIQEMPAVSKKSNVLPVQEKACVEEEAEYRAAKKDQSDPAPRFISETQAQNIKTLARSAKMEEVELIDLISGYGYKELKDIRLHHFPDICKAIVENFQKKKAAK